jgi:hypothetical protein
MTFRRDFAGLTFGITDRIFVVKRATQARRILTDAEDIAAVDPGASLRVRRAWYTDVLFPNQLPDELSGDLAIGKRLGAQPIAVDDPSFSQIADDTITAFVTLVDPSEGIVLWSWTQSSH